MVHLVLMKFYPGKFNENVLRTIHMGYAEIQQELKDRILSVHLWRNCIERDQNMDLMIQIDLSAPEDLQVYLRHPRHVALMQKYQSDIVSIVSFDREETE